MQKTITPPQLALGMLLGTVGGIGLIWLNLYLLEPFTLRIWNAFMR